MTADELRVIFFYVAGMRFHQQIIPVVHFLAEGIQRLDHFRKIGNDRLVLSRKFRQVMAFDFRINAEFDHLWVYQHELQFGRVLFVQQGCNDCIQSDRFSLSSSAGHQQVGHLAEIEHEDLICNRFPQGYRQVVFTFHKPAGGDDRLH